LKTHWEINEKQAPFFALLAPKRQAHHQQTFGFANEEESPIHTPATNS
jgi:hypothetical protein